MFLFQNKLVIKFGMIDYAMQKATQS